MRRGIVYTSVTTKYDKLILSGRYVREADSGKAFLIKLLNYKSPGLTKHHWFPHSQVELKDGGRVVGDYEELIYVSVPQWLVEKEKLEDYVDKDETQETDEEEQEDSFKGLDYDDIRF